VVDSESWSRSEGNPAIGRSWGIDGMVMDPNNPDRMGIFPIKSTGVSDPIASISVDGGQTWKAVTRPEGKHDGWTAAMVDWSDEIPQTIYGKEHHSENLWLSRDGGETWKKAAPPEGSYHVAVSQGALLAVPRIKGEPEVIHRSTDDGKTWQAVSEPFSPQQRRPSVVGERVYWSIPNGLLTSMDAGETWVEIGPIDPSIGDDTSPQTWGPVFGRTPDEMLVAISGHGYYKSADGGESWMKIADWADGMTKLDRPRSAFSIGWVPGKRLVYCAFLGGEAYRAEWDNE